MEWSGEGEGRVDEGRTEMLGCGMLGEERSNKLDVLRRLFVYTYGRWEGERLGWEESGGWEGTGWEGVWKEWGKWVEEARREAAEKVVREEKERREMLERERVEKVREEERLKEEKRRR